MRKDVEAPKLEGKRSNCRGRFAEPSHPESGYRMVLVRPYLLPLYCYGLYIRKSKIIVIMLEQVCERHGKWDLDYLFEKSEEHAIRKLMRSKGMGPKSGCHELVSEEESLHD